jgi:CRP/FNR family cyclic AMP-dependent transcriptional regulator
MKGPYGFELNESCRACKLRNNGYFCQLSNAALTELDEMRSPAAYPAGAVLFIEKQNARGVYALCEGEVKLSVSSSEGKTMILRIAKAGEMLGLHSVLSGSPYEVTAETLRPSQVVFFYRDEFLRFIGRHHEAYEHVVKQLGAQYQAACEQLRTVGLTSSPPEKMARLLLEWSADGQQTKSGTRIKIPLTHEEIAECIGVTRETVSRTLSEFRSQHLVTLQGSTMMIPNRTALENLVTV